MKRDKVFFLMFAIAAAVLLTILPMRAGDTDDRIESSFKTSYVYKTYLKDDSIDIEADDGVVTLTGTVSEEGHKVLARETAANLPGVISVDDKLTTTAENVSENKDIWIGRKLKLALLFHRDVSYSDTEIKVSDGVVTLRGEASNLAQKELTSEYANDIDNVKGVKNMMTVASSPKRNMRTKSEEIDDASVSAQVKTALLTHRSTNSAKTAVKTVNGDVTVTGIAKNTAERSLVTKLANNVKGVKGVNNRMTIKVTE